MGTYFHIKFLSFFITVFLVITTNQVSFAEDKYKVQPSENSQIEILSEVNNSKKEGTQQQAPMPAASKRYSYRYYPSCYVYYSVDRNLYYYLKDDNWKICAFIPSDLKKKLDEYVSLKLDTSIPYIYHEEHIKKFSQTKSDKKKKSFLARVIYIMLYKH
jgi:hypothetical protein